MQSQKKLKKKMDRNQKTKEGSDNGEKQPKTFGNEPEIKDPKLPNEPNNYEAEKTIV